MMTALLLTLPWAEVCAQSLLDDRGVQIPLEPTPRRIITLLPSHTETVCVLGACDRLVATDRFSNWPEAVRALPKVGDLDRAQVERIVALKPDLVIASGASGIAARLESLGLTVAVLDAERSADVRQKLRWFASLLGEPKAGERLWRQIQQEQSAAAARIPADRRGQRVYFELDATPYAAGETAFIGETLSRLGLRNIVPAELGAFPRLNPEFVVRAQPEIIIAVRSDLEKMPTRPGWASLRALQQRAVCAFEPAVFEVLVRPGPRMGEAAMLLAECVAMLPALRSNTP